MKAFSINVRDGTERRVVQFTAAEIKTAVTEAAIKAGHLTAEDLEFESWFQVARPPCHAFYQLDVIREAKPQT